VSWRPEPRRLYRGRRAQQLRDELRGRRRRIRLALYAKRLLACAALITAMYLLAVFP
jgi:hypothetical protein